jgi:biopolymer transport protein ExbB
MLAAAFERLWCFFAHGKIPASFMQGLRQALAQGDKETIKHLFEQKKGFFVQSLSAVFSEALRSETRAEKLLKIRRQQARVLFSRRLVLFGTLSNIAPLLGLLGTVIGIMRAFYNLSVSSSGGPNIIASGVSEALITTIAGIAVAVPAAVLNNYFVSRVKTIVNTIEVLGQELIFAAGGKR